MKFTIATAALSVLVLGCDAIFGPVQPSITTAVNNQLVIPGKFCKLTISADNSFNVQVIDGTANYGTYFDNIVAYDDSGVVSTSAGMDFRWKYVQTVALPFFPESPTSVIQLMVKDKGVISGFIARLECSDSSRILTDTTGVAGSLWKAIGEPKPIATCPSTTIAAWGDLGITGASWVGAGDCSSTGADKLTTYQLNMKNLFDGVKGTDGSDRYATNKYGKYGQ